MSVKDYPQSLIEDEDAALEHSLQPYYQELKSFSRLKDLYTSDLYRTFGNEIERVTNGLEWRNTVVGDPAPERLRVVAWNVERGSNLEGIIHFLENDPVLRSADILLLTETDIGMGRSGNRNVPREIALALGYNYCFANSFLVLGKGDEGEQNHDLDNTLAMHGVSILARHKIHGFRTVPLPEIRNAFTGLEKSLGQRRALICRFEFAGHFYDFSTVHLDVKASPLQRAHQLEAVCVVLDQSSVRGVLLGGDLNTHTYNLENRFTLLQSFFYKMFFLGVREVVSHYMMPDRWFEREVFRVFDKYNLNVVDYNDLTEGTIFYDLNEESLDVKTREWLPGFLYRYVHEILTPWNGRVPLRLDWMAGRGFGLPGRTEATIAPAVIEMEKWNGVRLSDHCPIVVDVLLPHS